MYFIPGMTLRDVVGMTGADRVWYAERIVAQKKLEAKEMKKKSR